MKKCIRLIIALLLLYFGYQSSFAQNYIRLTDASGLEPDSLQLNQLEAAADSLVAALPSEYQDSFKVFDFGFYLHNEVFQGGYPAVFENAIAQAKEVVPYYLIFGKQSDHTGVYTDFWSKLELPRAGLFSCHDDDFYDRLEFKILTETIDALDRSNRDLHSYALAEGKGMEYLLIEINELLICCDPNRRSTCPTCSWTGSEVKRYLELKGFDQEVVSISANSEAVDSLCICSTPYESPVEVTAQNGFEVVKAVSVTEFHLDSFVVSTSELLLELEDLANFYSANGQTFFGAVTDNSIFCNSGESVALKRSLNGSTTVSLREIESRVALYQKSIWIHIQYDELSAYLYVRTWGFGGDVFVECSNFPNQCDEFTCVLEKLLANAEGFFNKEIISSFYSTYDVDLVFRLSSLSNDYRGATSTLQEVVKSCVVEVKINPFTLLDDETFCDRDSLRYLATAETVLHESIHAFLVRLAAIEGGRDKVKFLNYGQRYLQFRQQYGALLGLWYTDHALVLEHFFGKIAKDLRTFNDNYLELENYYYQVWSFGFRPPSVSISALTGFTESELYWNYHLKLSEKALFPCCSE